MPPHAALFLAVGPLEGQWGCTMPLRCLCLGLHTDRPLVDGQTWSRDPPRSEESFLLFEINFCTQKSWPWRLILGAILTSPSLSFNRNSLANLGSQPVNKTHTNYSYLAVDTKRSTERPDNPLTWWSAVSCLTIMKLCYMRFGRQGEGCEMRKVEYCATRGKKHRLCK